jgi:hypothetical protein
MGITSLRKPGCKNIFLIFFIYYLSDSIRFNGKIQVKVFSNDRLFLVILPESAKIAFLTQNKAYTSDQVHIKEVLAYFMQA